MGAIVNRLSQSGAALGAVFRNPSLRRLELAWMASIIGNWSYSVALAVYAYREGGPAAVGLVGVIRLLPSALAAPFVAVAADRFPRTWVMVASDLLRAPLIALAGLTILWDGPAAVVYACVGLATVVGTAFRPAQAALLPSLARTPGELTAANVASSTFESVGSFAGPALGGILLAFTNPETVFFVNAASFVWSALLILRIGKEDEAPRAESPPRGSLFGEVGGGFRALRHERDLRVVVALYTAQTLVAGAFSVLVVVTALELLDIGEAGVGFLNSAVGVGGLLGALAALTLASRRRLAGDFALGVALYGAPLVLLVAWDHPVAAFVFLGLCGIGNTLTDISALTLMQRAVPDDVLGRVFGVLESLLLGSLALGALLAPLLVETLGVRTALLVTGLFLPALVLLASRRLARIDAGVRAPLRHVELLGAHPIFAPLPPLSVEQLAARLAEVRVASGEVVIRRGAPGDRFYLVESGELEAEVDGGVVTLGPGEGFGEIALLRDVPRTATVTARTEAILLAVEREDFLSAVTRDPRSASAADAVVAGRLGPFTPGVASV